MEDKVMIQWYHVMSYYETACEKQKIVVFDDD